MQSRHLNITALASRLELKNRNVIIRILNNKATSGTLSSFAETLKSHLDLTEEELDSLNMALEHEQIPDSVISSRQTLSYLFKKDIPSVKNELLCVLHNTKPCDDELYMGDDILDILRSEPDDDFEIHIEDINTIPFVQALSYAMQEKRNGKLIIHQYFTDTEDSGENMLQMYAIIKLSSYLSYYPYIISSTVHSTKRVCIMNTTKNTSYLLNVFDRTHYSRMDMHIAHTGLNEHMAVLFEMLKKSSQPLKDAFASPIEDLPEFLERMMKLDPITSYEIKSTPCFMLIPFEIQKELYKDSNYLGYGFDHPAITKIYNILKTREEKMDSAKSVKHYIYSKEGVEYFLNSGKTSDFLPGLRALSPEERRATLERVINSDNLIPHLFKDEYRVSNIECALYEGTYLGVFDPSHGYWDNYSEVGIKNKKMLRIMRDFIIEEIIKNCCYSPEETREILKGML